MENFFSVNLERFELQQPTKQMELACWKVREFWHVYGTRLESENGPGTFMYELVQKMSALHADIAIETGELCISVGSGQLRGKIQDIVSLQRRHIMQFELCLDEFNRYLTALQVLDVVLRPRNL
jgi:hypothetical protein